MLTHPRRSFAVLAVLALSATGLSASVAPALVAGSGQPATQVLVARVYFDGSLDRDRLAATLDVAEAGSAGGYLTVQIDAAGYERLRSAGRRVEIDAEATALANTPIVWGNRFYGGYHTVEELYAFLDEKVTAYPGLAQKIDVGDSWCKAHAPCVVAGPPPLTWNGYDLFALRITNRAIPGPKPVFWFDANIHAREIVAAEVALRFIDWLLSNYETNADAHWLVDYHDIYVMPTVNPDGHHMVEAGLPEPFLHRKNSDYDDGCTYWNGSGDGLGTDLNRNYPFQWGCCGGSSGNSCDQTYRGPSAGSEDETAAVMAQIRALIPDQRGPGLGDPAPITTTGVLYNLHTFGGANLYPWSFGSAPTANAADFANLAAHMSATDAGGNGYYPCQTGAWNCLYTMDGASIDWEYGELGAPAFYTELEGSWFFLPYARVDTIYANNQGMLTYLAKVARTPYLLAHGPDSNVPATLPVTVTQGSPAHLTATINYAWTNNAYSQTVAAAEYYVDAPPWAGGSPAPMSAVDGGFDSPVEAVQADVGTGTLSLGRHILFVRGRGAGDYGGQQTWGPMSAAFLWVQGPPTPTPTGTPPTPTRTPSPTPTPTATACVPGHTDYAVTTAQGVALEPAGTDVGNHCDECVSYVALPFPVTLYSQTFAGGVTVGSNGTLAFDVNGNDPSNFCLPDEGFSYAILPYWDDLRTDQADDGVFTSISGSAPDRVFNILWHATRFASGQPVDFEVRLHETAATFEIIYGTVANGGAMATVGVQYGTGDRFTEFVCNAGGLAPGLELTFALAPCALPNPEFCPLIRR